MIEKLECTCIEAYKTRKMRDPNCCACSCDHNDLVEQLAKANERVKDLESVVAAAIHAFDAYEMDVDTYPTIEHVMLKNNLQSHLNKFAIEKKIEGAKFYGDKLNELGFDSVGEFTDKVCEQLRKEQDQC